MEKVDEELRAKEAAALQVGKHIVALSGMPRLYCNRQIEFQLLHFHFLFSYTFSLSSFLFSCVSLQALEEQRLMKKQSEKEVEMILGGL